MVVGVYARAGPSLQPGVRVWYSAAARRGRDVERQCSRDAAATTSPHHRRESALQTLAVHYTRNLARVY
ncbi:unnamed protein product [Danaus chrysippus]|uniref:(African queen) hypothetical protein n=1 Tax=Danaus chrysippus TaxID=151541 RepID=A0A8J2R2J4_9NEOP|nr:unnamed protein product [Danaus chrysippus]